MESPYYSTCKKYTKDKQEHTKITPTCDVIQKLELSTTHVCNNVNANPEDLNIKTLNGMISIFSNFHLDDISNRTYLKNLVKIDNIYNNDNTQQIFGTELWPIDKNSGQLMDCIEASSDSSHVSASIQSHPYSYTGTMVQCNNTKNNNLDYPNYINTFNGQGYYRTIDPVLELHGYCKCREIHHHQKSEIAIKLKHLANLGNNEGGYDSVKLYYITCKITQGIAMKTMSFNTTSEKDLANTYAMRTYANRLKSIIKSEKNLPALTKSEMISGINICKDKLHIMHVMQNYNEEQDIFYVAVGKSNDKRMFFKSDSIRSYYVFKFGEFYTDKFMNDLWGGPR